VRESNRPTDGAAFIASRWTTDINVGLSVNATIGARAIVNMVIAITAEQSTKSG
jgi:hypothetical protein